MNHTLDPMLKTLQSAYDEQYSDAMTQWRELGAKHKAENILSVCGGRTFTRILECGAGEGSILKFLDRSGLFPELYAVEVSDSAIAQIKKRSLPSLKEVKKFNGYEIPFPDKAFDMAYCSHVIEHVEHPRLLLRELRRVSQLQVFEIPLDYSIDVDRNVRHFLSYGHINVYTPSLFKFLLKSEGYEVIAEKWSHTAEDVLRFLWYNKMGRKKSLVNELRLRSHRWRNGVNRMIHRESRFREFGYSAYTCLARGVGELKIF